VRLRPCDLNRCEARCCYERRVPRGRRGGANPAVVRPRRTSSRPSPGADCRRELGRPRERPQDGRTAPRLRRHRLPFTLYADSVRLFAPTTTGGLLKWRRRARPAQMGAQAEGVLDVPDADRQR